MQDRPYSNLRMGHHRIMCDVCGPTRSGPHRKDKCLSVDVDSRGVKWLCHHCGQKGAYLKEQRVSVVPLRQPIKSDERKIDTKGENWLSQRSISRITAEQMGVFQTKRYFPSLGRETDCLGFKYLDDKGHTVYIKYRAIPDKAFTSDGKCEWFYGTQDIKDQVDTIIIVEGECFPGDAEVLTPSGWVRLDQYDFERDIVLQVNADGSAEYVRPAAYITKTWSGGLIRRSVKGYVSNTTPGHNLVVSRIRTGVWEKRKAGSHIPSSFEIPRVCELNASGINESNDLIALRLAVSADGSLYSRPSGGWHVRMLLHKERKQIRLREILSRLGIKYTETTPPSSPDGIYFGFVVDESFDKKLPWSWVALATAAQREFILDEMVYWDGNFVRGRHQVEYSSIIKQNIDVMQALAHTSGKCSTIMRRKNNYGEWYKLSVLQKKKSTSLQRHKIEEIQHTGHVYCVSVPSGMILVRQEGSITVTGNCDHLSIKEVKPDLAVLSVPSGATNITAGAQIPYLWNAKPILDKAKKIYIGTDNDKAGDPFGDELARRLGRYRCWRVNWGEGCKDANDALVKNGWEGIETALKDAEPYPVDGLYSADHYFDKVDKIFDEGIGRGESTGIPGIDEYYTVLPGQLTVVSGVPNSGKSQVLDNIMINMSKSAGWKFAIASFENPPFIHIANLSSMVVEKDFFESPYGAKNRMTKEERDYAKDFVKDHFFFLQAEDGGLADLDSVLDRIKVAVLRYGIKGAVIDPYNYLSKPKDCTETEFVSEALTKIKIVASSYGIHVWLVSHPTKLPRQSDGSYFTPGGYEISGSSNFYNKSDCGFSIGRAPEGNLSEFKVWKTRYSFTGKNGSPFILWDAMRHIYVGANPPIEDDF